MPTNPKLKVGFILDDQFDIFDCLSAYSVFSLFPDYFDLELITPKADKSPVSNYHPGKVFPDVSIYQDPKPDIVVIGFVNPTILKRFPRLRKWLEDIHDDLKFVLSVCAGVDIYAQLGWLDGREASHTKVGIHLAYAYGPKTKWAMDKRWSHDGKYWSSSGVSAGLDMVANFIAKEIVGESAFETVEDELGLVILRNPKEDPYAVTHSPATEQLVRYLAVLIRFILPIFLTWFNARLNDESHFLVPLLRKPLSIRSGSHLRKIPSPQKRRAVVPCYDGMDLLSFLQSMHFMSMGWEILPILVSVGDSKHVTTKQGVRLEVEHKRAEMDEVFPVDWVVVPRADDIPKNVLSMVSDIMAPGGIEYALLPRNFGLSNNIRKLCKLVLDRTENAGFAEDCKFLKKAGDVCIGKDSTLFNLGQAEVLPVNYES